jgi:drug/metabolite transporter (DMT)-like permease
MVLFETPQMPQTSHVLLMGLSGGLIVCGHVCIFMAYKIGPARSVAPFMYSVTVWAVLLGLLLFNDVPNLLAIIGMALVVTAGVLIIVLDGRRSAPPAPVSAQPRYRAPLRKALG